VKGRIDGNGILTAKMPASTANLTVDVLVDFPSTDPAVESESLAVLAKSFGILPDIRRADQGEIPAPKSW